MRRTVQEPLAVGGEDLKGMWKAGFGSSKCACGADEPNRARFGQLSAQTEAKPVVE